MIKIGGLSEQRKGELAFEFLKMLIRQYPPNLSIRSELRRSREMAITAARELGIDESEAFLFANTILSECLQENSHGPKQAS